MENTLHEFIQTKLENATIKTNAAQEMKNVEIKNEVQNKQKCTNNDKIKERAWHKKGAFFHNWISRKRKTLIVCVKGIS